MANPLFINKPSIRFRNYFGIWEQKRLGDLISRGGSGGTPNTYNKQYYDGLIPFLGISDISNSDGVIYKTEKHISEDGLLNSAAWIVPKGAISLAMYASVGKVAILGDNIATSQAFYNMVFSSDNVRNFVYEILKKKENDGSWESLISTGTQANLNADKVINLVIRIPEETEEIKKISDLFLKLDHLIVLNQQKYHRLLCIKKSMLEKMFPKNGSNIPEIRFAGFTDAWEQRKVSELFRVTRGYVLAATQTETTKTDEKPYPVYSSQTKDKGLMGYYKDYLYEDAITWTTDGANAGTVNYRAGKFYCTNVCGVLLSNEVKANQMIAEALNNVAKGYVSYVGNPKLMNNVMADIVIQIPTQAEEREQISSFFASLDNLITLHQRKYEFLTKIKESLLNKMFI